MPNNRAVPGTPIDLSSLQDGQIEIAVPPDAYPSLKATIGGIIAINKNSVSIDGTTLTFTIDCGELQGKEKAKFIETAMRRARSSCVTRARSARPQTRTKQQFRGRRPWESLANR